MTAPSEIVREMTRDLVGDRYPDTGPVYATVLYRLWHGEGPGLEGHMSLATVEHIADYANRILAAIERREAEIADQLKIADDDAEAASEVIAVLQEQVAALRAYEVALQSERDAYKSEAASHLAGLATMARLRDERDAEIAEREKRWAAVREEMCDAVSVEPSQALDKTIVRGWIMRTPGGKP
jgi:hypothetical protein